MVGERLSGRAHLLAGCAVTLCGIASGVFVVAANAWMNAPSGFRVEEGVIVDIDVWRAMANSMWAPQALHMVFAAFFSVGFAVAGIHAWALLRRPESGLHRRALGLALWTAAVAAILMPLSGDYLAKAVADTQPIKLAALEGQFETETGAPLRIGGWPDEAAGETRYSLELPGLLSFLAHGDFGATVAGLNDFPRDEWPPVAVVHLAFQVMVGLGCYFLLLAAVAAYLAWKHRGVPRQRWFLRWLALSAPLAFVALEAGWTVTEVGRQPWIIYKLLRVADAVTPVPHLAVPFVSFSLLYLLLSVIVVILLRRHVFQTVEEPT